MERKKVGQLRLGHNATDIVFNQKKLSLKVNREQANKTSGTRGIQLNQNDIVFSNTMNLSEFLSTQTKKIANGSQTTTNQQQVSRDASNRLTGDVIPKNRASQEI